MTREELVVVVRDTGIGWVGATAAAVHRGGAATGLVTGPLTAHEKSRLGGFVDVMTQVDDPADPAQLAAAARELAAGRTLSAVLSPSDGAMVAAALAAEALGVARTPAAALARCRNKYAARLALRAAGLPTPRFTLLTGPDDALRVAAEVGLPAVVKPVNGTGSHLVRPVHTVAELAEAHDRLAGRLLDTAALRHLYDRPVDGVDPASAFLVEGMLRGPEYCVDVVVRDGSVEVLPFIHKFLVDERFFERGFVTPPIDLDADTEQRLRDAVTDAVLALGLDNTLACVEVMDDPDLGACVVEVNGGRPGGQIVGLLYGLTTGVDTSAEIVSLARGLPSPRTTPRLPIPLASFTLFAEATGTLRAVHGLDELAALDDVIHVVESVSPGDLLTDDHEIFAVNFVVAGFADTDDLEHTYQRASSLVRFEVDPL